MKFSENRKIYIALPLVLVFVFVLGNFLKKSENTLHENMRVVLTAKVTKSDVFQFFYWQESETNFKIESSTRTKVIGSDEFQEIFFDLPEIKDIHRLRLDIGENNDQGAVVIKGIRFIKDYGELNFEGAAFNKLFAPNQYINVGDDNQFAGLQGKNDDKVFYDPYFISRDDSNEIASIRVNRLTNYPYLISAFTGLVLFLFVLYNSNRISISQKELFIGAFFLVLLLPTLQSEIEFTPPLTNLEKRELAEKPEFSFSKKFARDFEKYYDDNFGLRNNFINWGGTYRTKLFRSSKHPGLVMFGSDKWLFYNRMDGRIYRSYSRNTLLSLHQQDSIVFDWQRKKEKYEAEGRKYFVSFWPNKHSIYPEHLPYNMKMQIKDTISRVDQLIERTKKNDVTVKFTDVRPDLIKNKDKGLQLYYKFDSHWNSYGAFLAYRSFFKQNPSLGIEPKAASDFNIKWEDYTWGELIQMLGVRNAGFFIEKRPIFTLKENKGPIEFLPVDGFPRLTVRTRNEYAGNKLKVLIFRDSFTNRLEQFFSMHFYEVNYIWRKHNDYYVRKLQPDIIIDGYVEREIGNIRD